MNYILVIIFLVLLIPAILLLLQINGLTLRAMKSKELNRKKNELDKKYQFIKGLY
jgi:competence protein ComGC